MAIRNGTLPSSCSQHLVNLGQKMHTALCFYYYFRAHLLGNDMFISSGQEHIHAMSSLVSE